MHDVVIVGGGINGAVSAAHLSSRGYKVALFEANDFASMTSQQSSNMIWGGIKYLQSFEFSLVWKLCASRNRLLDAYPTRVKEIPYFTSLYKGGPHWPVSVYAGAWLYWLMGRGKTFKPQWFAEKDLDAPELDLHGFKNSVSYADAYLPDNDARFVYNFIKDAKKNGAHCQNYCEVRKVKRRENFWQLDVFDKRGKENRSVKTKVLINACGPRLNELGPKLNHKVAFSKGVHLIVPKIGTSDRILTFFSEDKRLFFALPMGHRTCIGTTDTRVDSENTEVTDEDREFILENINRRLKLAYEIKKEDIIAERCGVRTLIIEGEDSGEDWIKLTRKHEIEWNESEGLLNIVGGKITDCLNVGEEVGDCVAHSISPKISGEKWFGEPSEAKRLRFKERVAKSDDLQGCSDGISTIQKHLWRRYGVDANDILDLIKERPNLGDEIFVGAGYVKAEFVYMAQQEDVYSLEDVLRRRTTLALEFSKEDLDIYKEELIDLLALQKDQI